VRTIKPDDLIKHTVLDELGLTVDMLKESIDYTHGVLDSLDQKLAENGEVRLAELIELANLSAVLGNLFRGGLAKASNGRFVANGPHKYPDLLSREKGYQDLEIKVALEDNKPKGHLIKPGPHVTIRYVLGRENGDYARGKDSRGNVAWIWEVRGGFLNEKHFNVSNTEGDSGKTAVINKEGMECLKVIYCDLPHCPFSENGRTYRSYLALRPESDGSILIAT